MSCRPLVLLAAASLLVACGAPSDQQQIRALDARFEANWNAHRWDAVCADLSPGARAELLANLTRLTRLDPPSSCAEGVERLNALREPARLVEKITVLHIEGGHATAPGATQGVPASESDDHFERIDGRWYMGGSR